MSSHYDATYFAWQRAGGEFGGWANAPKFTPYIEKTDAVIDFGCGGGFLLQALDCAKRIGVEVNPSARPEAAAHGLEVYAAAAALPTECADKVISNHALEHAQHPLQELAELRRALRPGGLAVFVVPCESIHCAYRPGNIDYHLYTWSPLNLGNLFTEAGFKVRESKSVFHRWPPGHQKIAKLGGRPVFELACRIYGHLYRARFQVHLVAQK